MLTKEDIKNLSNDDLKKELKNVNIVCGPITSTTRRIYENRLNAYVSVKKKQLDENQGTVKDDGSTNSPNTDTDKLNVNKENEKNKEITVKERHFSKEMNLGDTRPVNNIEVATESEKLSTKEVPEQSRNLFNGIADGIDENHFSVDKPVAGQVNNFDKSEVGPDSSLANQETTNQTKTSTDSSLTSSQPIEEEEGDGFFYGIWVPFSTTRIAVRSKPCVFVTKKSALIGAKKFSNSRFKQFKTREEAEHFSLVGPIQMSVDSIIEMVNNRTNNNNSSTENIEVKQQDALKTPSIQEVQQYRKYIESDDLLNVEKCLTNPKYLINSKDYPVTVHEGSRLNAMHVAVKFERLSVCERIMILVNSLETYRQIYPEITEDNLEFRKRHVENLYLNSPEKIICDTPLHMACKYGFKDIVKFLLTFPTTNIKAVNKDGRKAVDIICTRASIRGPEKKDLINEIKALFEDKAYIPLYHGQEMARVGPPIVTTSPIVSTVLNKDIRACLGPCSPCQAEKIYKIWKKPPREMKYHTIVRTDYEKGMERVGRSIAAQENLPYSEYWDFLGCHINLQTEVGLEKLEQYLKERSEVMKYSKTVVKKYADGAPSGRTKTRHCIVPDSDEIKRRLLFDNDLPSSDNDLPLIDDDSIRLTNGHENARKLSSTDEECYCRCGKLLGNCNDCAVDIDIDNLIVSFRMCCTIKDNSFTDSLNQTPDKSITDSTDGGIINEFDSPIVNRHFPDVYIFGDCPSKKDLDVIRAIGDYESDDTHPYVDAWLKRVTLVPMEARESWPTPGSPRYAQRTNKSVLWTA